jgi:hypothetical protein
MPDHEPGLYYSGSEDSFKTIKQIQYEHIDEPTLIREQTRGRIPTLEEWTSEFARRRDLRRDFEDLPEQVNIEIQTKEPIVIATIGDTHTGGNEVDYELLYNDIDFVATHPNAYAILGGDLIEGLFFNPGQDLQIGSWNEQRMYNLAMVEKLQNKILYIECGDHDMWSGKTGTTIYNELRQKFGIPIVRGSSRCNLSLPEVTYKIVSAHQLPGSSMYNDNHPQLRESKFGTQGADIYLSFHNHKKSFQKQVVDMYDECKEQLFVASGSYKFADEYSRKKGWGIQREAKRGGVFVVVYPFVKRMDAYSSAQEAGDIILKNI